MKNFDAGLDQLIDLPKPTGKELSVELDGYRQHAIYPAEVQEIDHLYQKYTRLNHARQGMDNLKIIVEKLQTKHGLELSDVPMVESLYQEATKDLDIDVPEFPSLQEFRRDGGRLRQTEVAMEGFMEVAKAAGRSVMRVLKALLEKIQKLFARFTSVQTDLSKGLDKMESLTKRSTGVPVKQKVNVNPNFFVKANEPSLPVSIDYARQIVKNAASVKREMQTKVKEWKGDQKDPMKVLVDLTRALKGYAIEMYELKNNLSPSQALVNNVPEDLKQKHDLYLSQALAAGQHLYLVDYLGEVEHCAMGVVDDPTFAQTAGINMAPAMSNADILKYIKEMRQMNSVLPSFAKVVEDLKDGCGALIELADRVTEVTNDDDTPDVNAFNATLESFRITGASFLMMFRTSFDLVYRSLSASYGYSRACLENLDTIAPDHQLEQEQKQSN